MSKEKLSGTARRTIELVARVGALVRELRTLADDAGVTAPDAPAEQLPTLVAQQLGTRVSALETAVTRTNAELSGEVLKIKARLDTLEQQPILGERVEALERKLEQTIGIIRALHPDPKALFEATTPETVHMVYPDVVAIVEPENAVFYAIKNNTQPLRLQAVDGVITLNDEQKAQIVQNELTTLYFASVADIKYVNFDHFEGFRFPENTSDTVAGVKALLTAEEKAVKLSHMGQPVGMERLTNVWWLTEDGGYLHRFAPTVRIEGVWNLPNNIGWTNLFMCRFMPGVTFEQLPEIPTLGKVNELDATTDVWTTMGQMFGNVQAYQFPTLDFKGIKTNPKPITWTTGEWMHSYSNDNWEPERVQHWIGKNIGHSMTRHSLVRPNPDGSKGLYVVQLDGLQDWDYDDMRATLIDYSCVVSDRVAIAEVELAPKSYDKLTDADKAAIIAKGYTLIKKAKVYQTP